MSGNKRGGGGGPPPDAPIGPRGNSGGPGQDQGRGRGRGRGQGGRNNSPRDNRHQQQGNTGPATYPGSGGGSNNPGYNRGQQGNPGFRSSQGGGSGGRPPNTGGNDGRPARQGQGNLNPQFANFQPGKSGFSSNSSNQPGSSRGNQGGGSNQNDDGIFGQGQIPDPDKQVTKLEDDYMAQSLDTSMKQTSLGKSKTSLSSFPRRPAFSKDVGNLKVWTNYFPIIVDPRLEEYLKYSIEVYAPGPEGAGPSGRKQVTGRKREIVFKDALKKIKAHNKGISYATEGKSQVISLSRLNLPERHIIPVEILEPRKVVYEVEIRGPTSIPVEALRAYLKDQTDPTDPDGIQFPKFEDVTSALGVILGHEPRWDSEITAVGKGKYYPIPMEQLQSERKTIGRHNLLWIVRGYYQSVRHATGRLLLNANVTHGIFRLYGPLEVVLQRIGRQPDVLTQLAKSLSKARMRCTVYRIKEDSNAVPPYKVEEHKVEKRFIGFAQTSDGTGQYRPQIQGRFPGPQHVRFYLARPTEGSGVPPAGMQYGRHYTVAEYYKTRYNVTLKANLPVINTGTPAKPIYLPAEHCEIIAGQPARARLTTDQAQDMINFACRKPKPNAISITTTGFRDVLRLNTNSFLAKFGISVSDQLVTVKARELKSPGIRYSKPPGAKVISTKNASWNMTDVKFVQPGTIDTWTWIWIDHSPRNGPSFQDIKKAVDALFEFITNAQGLRVTNRTAVHENGLCINIQGGDLENKIQSKLREATAQAKKPFDIALIILPGPEPEVYNAVKYLADVEFGFHTVCVQKQKLAKNVGSPSFLSNIGLKFNLKAGGANHRLAEELDIIREGKTMVVGYDVIHPTNIATDREGLPSQVGLVASIDKNLAQWPCEYWNQESKVEMLGGELIPRFKSRLELWQKHNNKRLPDNIIIFRDGVSEGQFKQVLETELPSIRAACAQLYGSKQPDISIIISVKRHHTRFYPADPRHMDRSSNIKNGTVVDRGITSARYWEFFLAAHQAIKGTTKPARYVVIYDEIFVKKWGSRAASEVENLTHNLCYLFGRATKAVSICPPAYYADIVCTRARVHMSRLYGSPTATDNASTSQASANESEILRRRVHARLKDSMYYI